VDTLGDRGENDVTAHDEKEMRLASADDKLSRRSVRSRFFVMPLVFVMTLAAAACSGFDPDAPWTLSGGVEDESTPIPEGTPIIEHEPVPIEARTRRIDLVEDLVIDRGAEPFYRLAGVGADAEGNIFVYDLANQNAVAFDRHGAYLRTIGRPGHGPGEFGVDGDAAVVDGNLVHVSRNRINVWSPEGHVLVSRNITFTTFLLPIEGTDDGGLVGFARRRRSDQGTREVAVRTDLEGNFERQYAVLPYSRSLWVNQGSRGVNTMIPRPRSDFAVARSGEVYVTAGSDYEVLALAADATPRWALRVAWPRMLLTDERIEQALRHVMGLDEPDDDIPSGITGVRRSDVDWPELLPALMGRPSAHRYAEPLKVDGHGHVYVFPFVPDAWDRPDQPVDVYSADGEHLFSGMIPFRRWDSARGDFVYGVGTDPVSEEYRAVRYRLVEPFR
jgi:hypothetical protein